MQFSHLKIGMCLKFTGSKSKFEVYFKDDEVAVIRTDGVSFTTWNKHTIIGKDWTVVPKTVKKWINVYHGCITGDTYVAGLSYDDKESALKSRSKGCDIVYLGDPIEIEHEVYEDVGS